MNKRGHVLNAALLSIGLGYVLEPAGDVATFAAIAEVAVPVLLGALLPDVDTAFGRHRKTLHNLPVMGVVAAYPLFFANLQWVWLGVLTHYVLDYFGSRRGIALFYPLSAAEFGFPSGVTTASSRAEIVTVAITGIELSIAVLFVHVVPRYVPTEAMRLVGLG